MYCTNPSFIPGKGFVRCNKCHGCLVGKKKEWADRLKIESTYWPYCYFVTYTYAPEFMPPGMNLSYDDVVLLKKRLGYYCGNVPTHFYSAEYGDESGLPHYHFAIFSNKDEFENIRSAWTKGRVGIERLTPGYCDYICGYTVKKLDKDDNRFPDRIPEFHGASRRPALGYRFLFDLLERIATDDCFRDRMLRHVYPPYSVRIAGKSVRLPPYVRNKLSPIWKEYNEKKQADFNFAKKIQDFEILKAIKKNLQRMRLMSEDDLSNKWSFMKMETVDIRHSLEERLKKAYKVKHRRI